MKPNFSHKNKTKTNDHIEADIDTEYRIGASLIKSLLKNMAS